jgi:simple sugar transport system permease protein
VLEGRETLASLDESGIDDPARLAFELNLVGKLYDLGFLSSETVNEALDTELETALSDNLVILRPDQNLILVGAGMGQNAIGTMPDNTAQELSVVFLRLGERTLLFFPAVLENAIVNSIRFIIAGLAVALGFKAGLFNIGAEGQIFVGAVFAVWVGFAEPFQNLSAIVHLPLMVVFGILGGLLWGSIPGILKAYTGAHEVITTIMMNFIALRLVEWLINSREPYILGDSTSSVPKTPTIVSSAMLPTFDQIPIWLVLLVAIVAAALPVWQRRNRLNRSALIRAAVVGIIIFVSGVFLVGISVRGSLHIGFLLMLAAVWLTDWFLERTTPGFEMRMVGANPNAARYGGINVARNIVLAMALSGALAGLAGAVEISGRQHNLLPGFFGGAGFDAIAVALLARTNPKSMIWAGLLWGGLLSGGGLMQIRADIPIELVKIIQAFIIMFVAADQIIRFLYRVPERKEEEEQLISTGWAGG